MNDNAAMNLIETAGPEALADIFDAMGGIEGGGYRPDDADKVWGFARAALIANGARATAGSAGP